MKAVFPMRMAAVLLCLVLLAGCVTDQPKVKAGDTIEVDYIGTLTDGKVFDTSKMDIAKASGVYDSQRGYTPLRFRVGGGQMISGFDKGVVGMSLGETKEIRILPKDAYGERDDKLVVSVPLDSFRQNGVEPVVGQTYPTSAGNAKVVSVSADKILLDYNHHLAGQTLIFKVTLLRIIS